MNTYVSALLDNNNVEALISAKFLQSVAEIDCSGYISNNFGLRLTNFTCKNITIPSYLTADNNTVSWVVDIVENRNVSEIYSIEKDNFNFILKRNDMLVATINAHSCLYKITETIYNQLVRWGNECKKNNNKSFLTSFHLVHLLKVYGFEVYKKFDTEKCTCYVFKLHPEHYRMRFSLYDKFNGNVNNIAEAIKKEFSHYENFVFSIESHLYAPELIKIHATNLEFS